MTVRPRRVRCATGGSSPSAPELSVVIPVRNESENIQSLVARTIRALSPLGLTFELLFIDDGSTDATPELLRELAHRDRRIGILTLSRNFGHQAAVSAGLDHARGRLVVVMDGDLQDPPELIPQLVAAWREGAEVVYAVRRTRREPVPLRAAYWLFYRLLRLTSDLPLPLDSGDFCLLDRRAVDAIRQLPERLRFHRGLRAYVGFRQVGVPYDRPRRAAGRTKYGISSLTRLAVDGLVSFSGYPLRLVSYLGASVAVIALGLLVWVLRDALLNHTAPRGWASLLVVTLFMGAIQMLSLGIVGEYVRGTYLEAKQRPTYILRDYLPGGGQSSDAAGRGLKGLRRHPAHPLLAQRPRRGLRPVRSRP